ncbi:MAG: UTRA domain-containing protein [Propionibacteriaceae bacterium]|jgi:DNA-binding GntR family transcriptional regulator|nr:UTRA domain-containing protein [Propionibacteriaceae bacterium]
MDDQTGGAPEPLINPDYPDPLWIQVMQRIGEQLGHGRLKPGVRLPPERQLALDLGVSRVTLRKALNCLVEEGKIRPAQGRGWYVERAAAPTSTEEWPNRLESFSETAARMGLVGSSRVLRAVTEPAGLDLAETLGIPPGLPIFHLERVRLLGGVPIAVDSSQIPVRLPLGAAGEAVSGAGLASGLASGLGVGLRPVGGPVATAGRRSSGPVRSATVSSSAGRFGSGALPSSAGRVGSGALPSSAGEVGAVAGSGPLDLMAHDFSSESLFHVLEEAGVEPVRTESTIEAMGADSYVADQLGIGVGDPILVMRQLALDATDHKLFTSTIKYAGQRYRLRTSFVR